MTSGGTLVRGSFPWESRHVPRTECWIPGVANLGVVNVLVAAVHNTLRKICMVGNETKGGGFANAPYSLLCSTFMTGTVMSTADCGLVALGAISDSDSSSESSESLSESCRVVSNQPTGGLE